MKKILIENDMYELPVFKPSIVHYASVSDCKMIIDELIQELSVFDDETNAKIHELLEEKKEEIDSRYNR